MTVITRDAIYINGEWVPSAGRGTLPVTNSTTEEIMGTIPEGTPDDVDNAVAAAKAAFGGWAATPPEERAKFCARIADGLGARTDEVATLVSQEVGMVKSLSKVIQVGLPYNSFSVIPQVVADFAWEEKVGNSLIVREPVGVVGAITPWNYPLHQIAAKVAYGLAAGCTIVLKPSEIAPLNVFVLADIIAEVGLPPGVFNLVSGIGTVVGEAIARHPDVDMVSFTGSIRAGKRVGELCMERVARVTLELGGKSASPSPTTPTTGWPGASGPGIRSTGSPWPAGSAPGRSRSTVARSTPTPPSAATSSPGSAGSTDRSGWTSSWRSRRSSCRRGARVGRGVRS